MLKLTIRVPGGMIMKKILALLVVGLLVLSACGSKDTPEKPNEDKTYKVGTGVVNNVNTEDASEEPGKFESNVTYVTVAFEGDKVAYVVIDEAQNAFMFENESVEEFSERKTKKELGDDYGMSKAGKVEWDEQVKALETYYTGKTVAEIEAGSTDSDLTSTVSINLENFTAALKQAETNAVKVDGVEKLSSASKTTGTLNDDGSLEITTTIAAIALDKANKVSYTFVDESQMKAEIIEGKVVANDNLLTKQQLKEDYGMSAAGKTEWYKQVAVLTDYVTGLDAKEVAKANQASDVTSTVSIYTQNFLLTH